ncbi:MAG: TrkA family potassium uptake protein [Coriobacteriales bacterium]|jgi:trk system potassium uptake protein TrkA|nr:TrkA family potassium uptake protein [Coriobacteriales bacterium]
MYIVINGGGKIGEFLAAELLEQGNAVAVIEKNPKKAERLSLLLEKAVLVINGDGCDSTVQAEAGVDNADVFVATTGADDVNLVSAEIATIIHSAKRCIARVNNPKNERIFNKIGVKAVSSTTVIARIIENDFAHQSE